MQLGNVQTKTTQVIWVKYTVYPFVKFCIHISNIMFLNNKNIQTTFKYVLKACKELGFFHIIIARTLTFHKICLADIMPSIWTYGYTLGYIPSIKVEGPITIRRTPLPSFLVNFSTFAFLLNFSFMKLRNHQSFRYRAVFA